MNPTRGRPPVRRDVLRCAALSGLLLAGLGATGCATVRRAREAQKPETAVPGERTATAAEAGLSSNTVLGRVEAERIALAVQPSVVRARRGLEVAEAQVTTARSAYGPSVGAGAGYSRRTSNSELRRGSSENDPSYSASADLDLLIYDFGRTPATVRQAVERRLAAEQDLRTARIDAVYAVRSAFFDLAKAQELRAVAEEAVRQFRVRLDQVRSFAEVGQRTRYDVTKAELDLGNARLNLIDARNAEAAARATLNRSLGLAEEPGYRLGEGGGLAVEGAAAALMARARESHPELRSLRALERAASAAVDAAIAELYPDLSLRASYAFSGGAFPLVWNWSAALQSALTVFDRGRRTAGIDSAVAQMQSARTRVADREQQIYLDLTRALNARDTARERLGLADLNVRVARETLELVVERDRLGKATAVELTDAQVALIQAQGDQVKARFDHETAVAQILHTIGGEEP